MSNVQNDKLGKIHISDEVLTVCATNATLKIPGVSKLGTGLTNKGVRISKNDGMISFDIYIIVEYQTKIPQLAWDIQSAVKKETEAITDEKVKEINIHVQGVSL